MNLVFLDTETTGLDERVEDLFEVGLIRDDGEEMIFRFAPRGEVVSRMHPKAAEVNRYHERTSSLDWRWHHPEMALHGLYEELWGAHICGAVPDFDARHLTALYRRFAMDPPRWHHHLIDIESMAVGWLYREPMTAEERQVLNLPWESEDLSRACGVEPPSDDERHTALGDARWVKRWYETITGGAS